MFPSIGKTDSLQKEIDAKKLKLAPWNEKLNAKKSEIGIKETQIELLLEKTTGNEKSVHDTEGQIDAQNRLLKERVCLSIAEDVRHYWSRF